jgi:integrase
MVDGVRLKPVYFLGTDNQTVARRKMAQLIADLEAGKAASDRPAVETLAAYGEAWLGEREKRGLPAARNERRYFDRVWRPALGNLTLDKLRGFHIQNALNELAAGKIQPVTRKSEREGAERRYSRASIVHARAAVLRMLESAWREEIVVENVAKRSKVPDIDEPKKARAVLTDSEIAMLCLHPAVDSEIKVLLLLSRTIGGLRTGDLNALDWTAFGPEFSTCSFVRRKTRRRRPGPQTLLVPPSIRPIINAWWVEHGSPTAGPVFPARRGGRVGQAKLQTKQSYAERLRRELLAAGITRHELHHETPTTLPVDFHSTRRAYATALARVGLNEQTAMVLTGHSDPKVHQRYIEEASIRALPDAAVPLIHASSAGTIKKRSRRPTTKPQSKPTKAALKPTG